MARMINWNTAPIEAECIKAGMDRLELAAKRIAEEAKRILRSRIKGPPVTRVPGRRNMVISGRLVPSTGAPDWMEREPGAMIATIRVVRKRDSSVRNIWIMAGNRKTWWARQMEYGRGDWKGGPKAFLRPALHRAPSLIRGILESGQGETR